MAEQNLAMYVQPPNVLGSFMQGQQQGQQMGLQQLQLARYMHGIQQDAAENQMQGQRLAVAQKKEQREASLANAKTFAGLLMGADTPEKFEKAKSVAKMLGAEGVEKYTFDMRDSLLDSMIKAEEVMTARAKAPIEVDTARAKALATADIDMAKAAAGASRTSVVNVMPGDKQFNEKLGEQDAARFGKMREAADSAQNMMGDLNRLEAAVKSFPTGAGADWYLAAGKALQRFGVDVGNMSEGEVIGAISSRLTGLQRVPGSGATSDFEQKLYMNAVPGLTKTPEGNLKLIDMGRRLARRNIEITRLARDYMEDPKNRGRLDSGFDAIVDKLPPTFTEDEVKLLSGAGQTSTATKGPTGPKVTRFKFDSQGNEIQ